MEVKSPCRIARFPGWFCGIRRLPGIEDARSPENPQAAGHRGRQISGESAGCRASGKPDLLRRKNKPADNASGPVFLWFCGPVVYSSG